MCIWTAVEATTLRGWNVNIGILEDDVTQQELYGLWFESAHHSCRCYGSVAAFKAAIKSEHFDLLLIDWMLPDGSGDEVIKWLRDQLGWEPPVIFVTARDSERDIVTALRAGADDYLVTGQMDGVVGPYRKPVPTKQGGQRS